ncbi:hypothetical protein PU629_06280 [Pullulanibacillus sp. KACC 23026]|uniref:hypothetical protein n=1 Tax=Pullulanibacillus sp. KACC 23026 TaxID=3028315 RepID=UPI0023B14A3D|nr:hypothetical protein [Pullulanibacillus sp. KACC 23026]WEG13971.1 hypothetical protein PU629_06280 [Pullulanibacillus sp. KACC 23026]
MLGYSKEEQETTLVFNNEDRTWSVYSTVPKHIRKLQKITQIKCQEVQDGKILAVKATLSEKQVSMKKEIVWSEERKNAASKRLKQKSGEAT